MKTRVTLTIDPKVLKRARRIARDRDTSVSAVIEDLVRSTPVEGDSQRVSFSEKWAGRFELVPDNGEDPRRSALLRKYGRQSK
ncbi:MAG: ribbon-helix-helix protein, CopG family [Acidobacteria bacterium]|nr:MAG: ribbon-helix-helix protein, CopG family [Acidobacteriota bacterium]